MARSISVYRRRPGLIDLTLQSGVGSQIPARATAASYDFYVSSNFDGTFTKFQRVPIAGYKSPSVTDNSFSGESFSLSRTPRLTRFTFNPSDYSTVFTGAGVSDLTPIWLRIVQNNQDGSTNSTANPVVTGTIDLNTLAYGPGGDLDTLVLSLKHDGGSSLDTTFAAPVNRGDVIGQINAVTVAGGITASINNVNELVLTGTGLGSGHNIQVIGDAGTLTVLGLTAATTTGAVNILEAPHLILPYSTQPNRSFILNGTAPNKADLAHSLEIQLPMQVNDLQVQNNGGVDIYVAFEPTGPEFTVTPLSSSFTNLKTIFQSTSQIFVRGNGSSSIFNVIAAARNNPVG